MTQKGVQTCMTMSMHAHLDTCWTHSDMFGHIWTHLDTFGHSWTQLDTVEHIWTHLNTFGHIWTHLDTFGHIWTHVDTFGHIWTHLDTFGHMWTHVDTFGQLLDTCCTVPNGSIASLCLAKSDANSDRFGHTRKHHAASSRRCAWQKKSCSFRHIWTHLNNVEGSIAPLFLAKREASDRHELAC